MNVLFVLCVLSSIPCLLVAENRFGIEFGNEAGQAVEQDAIKTIEEALNTFYLWQDTISFAADETVRNIVRYGHGFKSSAGQIEINVEKIQKKLQLIDHKVEEEMADNKSKAEEDWESKKSKLIANLKKYIGPVISRLAEETANIRRKISITQAGLEGYYANVTKIEFQLEIQERKFQSLRNSSMADIIDKNFQLKNFDKKIKRTLESIDNKNEKIEDLLSNIVNLNIGQIVASTVLGLGTIAAAALVAVETALNLAADSLKEEVHNMTQQYLDDCNEYNNNKADLDFIAIDLEKIGYYKERFDNLRLLFAGTETNKGHNLKQWKEISFWFGHLSDNVSVAGDVLRTGLVDYSKMDIQNMTQAWERIQSAAKIIV